MWQKYGDSGSGIYFGFDIESDKLFPVNYVDSVNWGIMPEKLRGKLLCGSLDINDQSSFIDECLKYFEPVLLTKFSNWSQEKEDRAYLHKSVEECGFYYFDLQEESGLYLQAVVLGPNCTVAEDEINSLLANFSRLTACRRPEAAL